MPFETDVFGTQTDPAPLFSSHFNMRGVFSTSPDPPSCRNARRGVCSPPPPLRLAFQCEGSVINLPSPSLALKRETGGFFTTTTPLVCVSTQGGVFNLSRPSLASKCETGGFFNTTTPSARVSTWGGGFRPLLTLPCIKMQDGKLAHPKYVFWLINSIL